MRDPTAAIAASVFKTTHRPGLFHQQHFLVHRQTSYTKHVFLVLSSNTGRISEWIAFGQSHFVHRKLTECCSLWDAYHGNITIFVVYK